MHQILSGSTKFLLWSIAGMILLAGIPLYAHSTNNHDALQQRIIRGKVVSADDGLGFPGANVIVKGTSTGTVTDSEGNYSLEVSAADATLVVSAIGYAAREIPIGAQSVIDVTLEVDVTSLAEVVVVGYGTVKKSDVTGSVVKMTSDQIVAMPVQNTLQALQGRAAGIDVTSNARPGELGTIRIRGTRSLLATNDPLYVVDGIPMQSGGIDAINPTDIESIEVLKDASASAIYGSRAANGVILVTTKKGKAGKAQVSYAGSVYFERINDLQDMFNAGEYAEYRRNAYRSVTGTTKYSTPYPNPVDDKRILGADAFAWESIAAGYTWVDKDNLVPAMRPATAEEQAKWGVTEVPIYDAGKVPTTDWTDYVNQTGVTQDHNVNVSMGTDRVKAFFSGGYLNQSGTSKGQDYKRYTGRVNLEIRAVDWLTFGASMATTYSIQNYGYAGSGSRAARTIYEAAKGMLPFAVPYDTAGNYIYYPGGDINIVNPIREDEYVINERSTLRILGSFFAEAKLAEGLRFRTNFGPDLRNYKNGEFQFRESILRGGGAPSSTNYARYRQDQQVSWTWENLLFYDKTFGDHKLGLTLLQSSSLWRQEGSDMTATSLPYNSQLWYNLRSTTKGALDGWGSSYSKRTLMSYMGRVNYSFRDKYLLTVSGRWDGASVLANGNKWDFFPSFALAWKMNEESFLQGVDWISELKPRIGMGTVGNAAVDPYNTAGGLLQVPYVFGSTASNGYVPSNPKAAADEQGSIPNPDLGWEKTKQWNFGVDFGLFNDRVTGSIDYYIADTYDLLMSRSTPYVTGYGGINFNVGKTQNRGIEVSLSTINIDQGNFKWASNVTFTRNRGEIIELYNGKFDDIAKAWFIGEPLQVYYDYKKIGIWQTDDAEEMTKFNENGATYKAGDIRVEDVNGDYKIDQNNDRQILGTNNPQWNGGITNTFSYKNWELSAFVYARWGAMIEGGAVDMQGRYSARKVDYWTPENPTNAYPRADYSNGGVPVHYSAMNYQNGSFVKVRYISIAYVFPHSMLEKIHISEVRLYGQLMNPFLHSKTSFIDPDINSGISSRSLVFGLNVSF